MVKYSHFRNSQNTCMRENDGMKKKSWLICLKKVSFISVLFLSASLSVQVFAKQREGRANISDARISMGIRSALTKGVKFAVDELGVRDGFYKNRKVKIPLPKSLKSVARAARFAGYGDRVDAFELSLNRAAEKAVPVAIDIFIEAIKKMSFNDARKILFSDKDDAATQFFRRTTEDKLRKKFFPIVEKFTDEAGVTRSYKRMMDMDEAGFIGLFLGKDVKDLDGYVTKKALDGLFYMVAREEKKIRKDPLGRTTKILRDIFSLK